MKTSNYSEDVQYVECSEGLVSPGEVEVRTVEIHRAVNWSENDARENGQVIGLEEPEWAGQASRFVSAEDLSVQRMETQRQKWKESQASLASSEVSGHRDALQDERWSDTQISPPSEDTSVARESLRSDRWSDCHVSPPGLEDAETVTSDTEPAIAPCEPISDLYYTASSDVSLLSDTELPDKPQPEKDSDKEEKECVIAGHVAAMRERFESMTRANTPCPDALDVFRNITPSPDLLG